jgi:hypothetical protein
MRESARWRDENNQDNGLTRGYYMKMGIQEYAQHLGEMYHLEHELTGFASQLESDIKNIQAKSEAVQKDDGGPSTLRLIKISLYEGVMRHMEHIYQHLQMVRLETTASIFKVIADPPERVDGGEAETAQAL